MSEYDNANTFWSPRTLLTAYRCFFCGTLKTCVTEHKDKPWRTWVEIQNEPPENDLDTYFSTYKEAELAINKHLTKFDKRKTKNEQIELF